MRRIKILTRPLAILMILTLMSALAACSNPEDKKINFLEKGDRLYAEKEYQKAKLEYQNAIQIDPEFAKGYLGLGKTYIRLKNFKKAYATLSKAVKLAPESIEARIELGRILLAGRAEDKAGEQADAVLALDPDHLDGSLLKASVFYMKKEFDLGDALLKQVYTSGNRSPELFVMLASAAARRGDMAGAAAYLEKGRKTYPDALALILSTARLAAKQKKWDQVIQSFETAIALKPDMLRYRLDLAKVYLIQEDKDTAGTARVLDRALSDMGSKPEHRMTIARFCLAARQIEKAEAILKNGIETDPDNFEFRLLLAQVYTGTRQLDKAEACLRRALELDPDPGHPKIILTKTALAKLLLATARKDEGRRLAEEVLDKDPKNLDAHFIKGRLFLMEKDGVNAVPEFRIVAQERPDAVKAHLNLAAAHMLCNEKDLALDILKDAYKANPGKISLLKAQARLYIMDKDFRKAEALLIESADAAPGLGPRMDLGDFYAARREYDKALAQYQKARDLYPKKPDGYLKAAAVHAARNQHGKAMDELRAGYGSNPDSAHIIASLVKGYLAGGQADSAEHLCRERLGSNPKEAFTWNLLGNVYMGAKKLDQAMSSYEKAAGITPEWGVPYDNMARIYLARENKAAAVERFTLALEKNPKNVTAWMVLAGIYVSQKEYDKAAQTYERAFEQNPRLWSAANNFAYTLGEATDDPEQLRKAMVFAQKALALNPESETVLDTLGWIQHKLGALDAAKENIGRALARQPENPLLNYHMGVVMDQMGDRSQARTYLEKSLALGKDFPGADHARQRLADYDNQAG